MKPINETLSFNKNPIHVRYDANKECVEWLCLQDLCKVLQRNEYQDISNYSMSCRSSKLFPIYSNGKKYWFIKIFDVKTLTDSVRKENSGIAQTCDELLEWAGNLPTSTPNQHAKILNEIDKKKLPDSIIDDDSSNLIVLNYGDKPISLKAKGETAYINATEMAKPFEKAPREWLNLTETKKLRQILVDQGKSKDYDSQVKTIQGSSGATWLDQNLGLEFARWLSPDFSNWCNEQMQELITQGMVVLNKKVESTFSTSYGVQKKIPADYKEALLQIVAQEEYIEKQNQKIEEDKPKVEFYDDFIENRDSFKTAIIAEELRISVMSLYSFLKEENIIRYNVKGKYYETYPGYNSLQCDHPYYWIYPKTGKQYKIGMTKRWTPYGREFILELYRKKQS